MWITIFKFLISLPILYFIAHYIAYFFVLLTYGSKKYKSRFKMVLYNDFKENPKTLEYKSSKNWGYFRPFLNLIHIKVLDDKEEENHTVAHEFAHYLHHKYLGNLLFYSEDVKEDFADWFAECYIENNFEIINSSSVNLQKKFSTIYPELFNYEL